MINNDKLYIVDNTFLHNTNLSIETQVEYISQICNCKIPVICLPLYNKELINNLKPELINAQVAINTLIKQNDINESFEILKKFNNIRLRLVFNSEIIKGYDINNPSIKKDVINLICDSVKYAKKMTEEVELIIEDTNKFHKVYIFKMVEAAFDSGCFVVTLADNNGYILPWEYGELLKEMILNIPEYENTKLGVKCGNKLGNASANALTAIFNGASQVDVTFYKSNNSCVYLGDLINTVHFRNDVFKFASIKEEDQLMKICNTINSGLNKFVI